MDDLAPPWIALPGLTTAASTNQGLAETYIVLTWLPFWRLLTPVGKAGYLDRWSASPEWREAIALRYDHEAFDADADAREAREWAIAQRQAAPTGKSSSWDRLKRIGQPPRR
ncbi:hypothetical protein [Lichenicola sp.]|uniref:hypothetical protein n=1 Tax=Lichenicola sp. TaxID=2804529 RepID=UPI003AFF773A